MPRLSISILVLSLAMTLSSRAAPPQPVHAETVVLLHGMARTRWSMELLARRLRREGYHVVNETYPSRRWRVERIASDWLEPLLREKCPAGSRIHFVTHSLGGIVVRQYLSEHADPRVGRTVMFAPPNRGSRLADLMARFPPARWVNGPAMGQLTTRPDSLPNRLGPPPTPVGVIAGTVSLNPLFSAWINEPPDDGKVSVAQCRLEGQADFLEVASSHTWLMNRAACHGQVLAFLRTGRFQRGD